MSTPALPTFQAAGTSQSGTGALTVAWPTHQTDDVALLVVVSQNETISLTTPAGFTELSTSPQNSTGSVLKARLAVFWARATSSSMSSPVVGAQTKNRYARIYTFRNCVRTGNPFEQTAGGTNGSGTAPSVAGATTKFKNDLVCAIVGYSTLSTTPQLSGWTNSNLASITQRGDESTLLGGGAGLATGTWVAGGAYGATTATLGTSCDYACISVSLRPRWSVDSASGGVLPQNATEWTDFIADTGQSIANPDGTWLWQEASGNFADAVGSFTLTASSSPNNWTYQAAITGLTAVGANSAADNKPCRASSSSSSLPDLTGSTSASSYAQLGYFDLTNIPSGNRDIIEFANATGRVRITSTPRIAVVSGSNVTTGTKDPVNGSGLLGGTVIPVLVVVNKTAGTVKLYTHQEKLSVTAGTWSSTKSMAFGGQSGASNSPTFIIPFGAMWIGANAEFSDQQAGALINSLGIPTLYEDGALNVTLDAATVSAAGTVKVQGAATPTLDAVTTSAAGAVKVQGSTAATLDAATTSATGAVVVSGSAAVQLEDASLSADGTVTSNGVTGSLDVTLGDASTSATGAVLDTGSVAVTLDDVAPTAAGRVLVAGSAAAQLDPAAATSAGAVRVAGAASVTLEDLTLVARSGSVANGSLDVTLGDAAAAATGAARVAGAGAVTLDDAAGASAGTVRVAGAGSAQLDATSAVGTGKVRVSGAASPTLDDVASSASGTVALRGAGAVTLGAATSSAQGRVRAAGSADALLQDTSLSSDGVVSQGHVRGALDAVLGDATAAGSGAVRVSGSASPTLADVAAFGSAAVLVSGSAAVSLGDATSSAAGGVRVAGAATVLLGDASAFGIGVVQDATPDLPGLLGAAVARDHVSGAAAELGGVAGAAVRRDALAGGVAMHETVVGAVEPRDPVAGGAGKE